MDKNNLIKKNGAVLLLLLVVLIAVAGSFVSGLLGMKVGKVNQNKVDHDYEVLQKAKKALLSYAVNYSFNTNQYAHMGRLPCPDLRITGSSSAGVQDSRCGSQHANSVGFFPWKTLGIDTLRDSSSECLWYVVSGEYKTGPKAKMRNEDTNGLLRVQDENGQLYHGTNPSDRPIALIVAPGSILRGQSHAPDCQGNSVETNYLESDGSVNYKADHTNSADKIWTYVYGTASSRLKNVDFNDKIIWLTKDEYWNAIKAQNSLDITSTLVKKEVKEEGDSETVKKSEIEQLTAELTQCFSDYANDDKNEHSWLPWPANIEIADYRHDSKPKKLAHLSGYKDQNNPASLMGRLPQSISISHMRELQITDTEIITHSEKTDIFSICLNEERKALWRNWKDHYFYAVSQDFEMVDGSMAALSARCAAPGDCLNVSTGEGAMVSNKIAAIVFYSSSVVNGQSRNYPPTDEDEKNSLSNYLDTKSPEISNAHDYPVDDTYVGNVNTFYNDIGDLVYCIWVNAEAKALETGRCV